MTPKLYSRQALVHSIIRQSYRQEKNRERRVEPDSLARALAASCAVTKHEAMTREATNKVKRARVCVDAYIPSHANGTNQSTQSGGEISHLYNAPRGRIMALPHNSARAWSDFRKQCGILAVAKGWNHEP